MNLATCRITTAGTLVLYATVLLRIMFGPFSYLGVAVFHYTLRICIVSFLTMITFNRVLKALFIYDFDRLSLIPDQRVMIVFGVVTALSSVIHFILEWVTRHVHGMDHYGRWDVSAYLGEVVELCLIYLYAYSVICREIFLK